MTKKYGVNELKPNKSRNDFHPEKNAFGRKKKKEYSILMRFFHDTFYHSYFIMVNEDICGSGVLSIIADYPHTCKNIPC